MPNEIKEVLQEALTEAEPEPTEEFAEDTTEEPQDKESRELWAKVMPELADNFDELSPGAQRDILAKRLAAISVGDAGTNQPESAAGSEQKPSRPSVGEIPNIDQAELIAATRLALEEGDWDKFSALQKQQFDWQNAMTSLVDAALREQGDRMGLFENDLRGLTMPQQVQSVLGNVHGAKSSDIPAAVKLLESGNVKGAELALKVVVADRNAELNSGKQVASEKTKSKAAAIAASNQGGRTRFPGQPASGPLPISFDSPAGKALIREEATESKNK